jgi:hypothetical protein
MEGGKMSMETTTMVMGNQTKNLKTQNIHLKLVLILLRKKMNMKNSTNLTMNTMMRRINLNI